MISIGPIIVLMWDKHIKIEDVGSYNTPPIKMHWLENNK